MTDNAKEEFEQFIHMYNLSWYARYHIEKLVDRYDHIIGDYLIGINTTLGPKEHAVFALKLGAYPNTEKIPDEVLNSSTSNTPPELASRWAWTNDHVDEFIEELFSNVLKLNQKLYEHRHGATND
ncbi:hypothetical protein [Auritidibacter ignavus]|uniref:hypothetical protein n=1 Tax=Auritidibacter ignavus TaxID=678932 RepID=UPI000F0329CD|nr:hypothetical protein [Auritidibacter ignavus]NIH70515.1 hypothetical protein [Auritidibacter ignavus]RMX23296.1 hypothetical protein DYI20_05370 [Auritidibacter ignavus]